MPRASFVAATFVVSLLLLPTAVRADAGATATPDAGAPTVADDAADDAADDVAGNVGDDATGGAAEDVADAGAADTGVLTQGACVGETCGGDCVTGCTAGPTGPGRERARLALLFALAVGLVALRRASRGRPIGASD